MSEWNDVATGWDDDPAVRAYSAAAFRSLLPLLRGTGSRNDADVLNGADVLDFGCGTGLLTERLVDAGATVVAVDTSSAMLAVLDAKIASRGWSTVTSATELPPDERRFDLVVCSSVLAFVDDHPGTVAALVERLRPGGRFVQWDWARTTDDDHGLTVTEIRMALSAAGLVDVDGGTAFSVDVDGHTMAPLIGTGRRPTTDA